ncbi:MAG: formylglycine-generating enzyme family protein [Pirellula sp.]|nr:formylglycine-generating enzyme family protein [Pirellula sp.]
MTRSIRSRFLAALIVVSLATTSSLAEADGLPREIVNSQGAKFVEIPAGEFLMGSSTGDDDERPPHRVRITKPFFLARFEVTQREYAEVMGENPSWFSPEGGGRRDFEEMPKWHRDISRLPVESVSWLEATEYCRKLSALPAEQTAGRSYRLPTEAEWEYAARAGTTTDFAVFPDQAMTGNFVMRNYSYRRQWTWPVGSFWRNRFGLFDMHGNVWEWCADRYDADYYAVSPSDDPPGPTEGTGRVVRGGDYRSPSRMARASNRDFTRESRRDEGNGIRVVLELP